MLGDNPNVSHERITGCRFWIHFAAALRHMLEPRAVRDTLIGNRTRKTGWRELTTGKLEVRRDVNFWSKTELDRIRVRDCLKPTFPTCPHTPLPPLLTNGQLGMTKAHRRHHYRSC